MFDKIEVFQLAHAMARHAGSRHAVVARNMANADTPGYKAQDIASFQSAEFQSHLASARHDGAMRATRPSHLNTSPTPGTPMVFDREDAIADPNGNTVSLETEMMHGVNAKRQHDRAMAIYQSSMTILRNSIGRR